MTKDTLQPMDFLSSVSATNSRDKFREGLVFGFDVGTGSIGYAVRKGSAFLDVGVLICESEGSDLSKRRDLRRARRTLRSRKFRRKWFAQELANLGLAKPTATMDDPITLRLRAVGGEKLTAVELHVALTHLFKRRGYTPVPWANAPEAPKEGAKAKKSDDDEGVVKEQVKEMQVRLAGRHPCQYLTEQRMFIGSSPTEKWARKIYWPREALEEEFRAIVAAQSINFPALSEKAEWLLFGETKEVKGTHVYFSHDESRNPGVLGMKWPRFDNRGPALDSMNPLDEEGRPLHVVRKNKPAFTNAQWELALMNFRVLDASTRQKIDPRETCPEFIAALRTEWVSKGKVTEARLKKLAKPYASQFLLMEDQKPLSPEGGQGRARYSSPTLEHIHSEISAGRRVDPPQPVLMRGGEDAETALNRYLADIKHPLVRHRLELFRGILRKLVKSHGQPDLIVLEAVRSLALGQTAKNELNKRNESFRKERENARELLGGGGHSVSRKAITRYRLWKEADGCCPFCGLAIAQADLGSGADIEHLVPRARVDCNELFNLTVAHIKCNRELKGDRTPFEAFGGTPEWVHLKANAEKCFKGRKLEIFLSPDAEKLVESKTDLQHTAYIARVIRGVALIQLGWISKDGRDPTTEAGNKASSSFQVTNGQLTSRLRNAWGLNQILHPLPPGQKWDDLSDEEKKRFTEKNRGDLRHHALDAIVIVCTLPWLAHRTHGAKDEEGRQGWWTQDEKQRSKAANPVFPAEGQMHKVCKAEIEKVVVKHHVSRSKHQQAYATTLYAKKAADTYVAREVFTTLTVKNLGSIWPQEFATYCEKAWERYEVEADDIAAELKKTKNCVPLSFTSKLCFSHFQRWRELKQGDFSWPECVKMPVRSVRLISVKDDTAVAPFSSGTKAYVKRTGFREVRIHVSEDGKSFVPVFVPHWKGDQPIHEKPIQAGSKPVAVIRVNGVIETKKPFSSGHHAGKYRVTATGQVQLKLLPHHVLNKEDAILAYGLKKKGIQVIWQEAIRALGYELPHSASAQSEPAGSTQT